MYCESLQAKEAGVACGWHLLQWRAPGGQNRSRCLSPGCRAWHERSDPSVGSDVRINCQRFMNKPRILIHLNLTVTLTGGDFLNQLTPPPYSVEQSPS